MASATKRLPLVVAALAACATAGSSYDFFARARYPGPGRVKGVDLYKVEQEGGPFAKGYLRRVVDWWPRRGVDVIDVEKAMPLRTWTFRKRADLRVERDWLTRQLPLDWPLKLKAHLIGFRGIGNRYAPSGKEDDFVCPAAVLRLPDGRKRCFARGTFVEADEKYLLDLFLKEMKRVRATLKKVKYEINPSLHAQWPNNAKPGEPGTMQVVGEHVIFVSGSQHAPGDVNNPWVGSAHPERAARFREGAVVGAETWWAYNEYMGNLMPCWDRKDVKYKYAITVCGTYRDGYKWIPGYAGGGYGACGLKNALGGPWSVGLFHEWVHGHAAGRWRIGGGEIQADAGQTIADPAILNFINNVSRPWRCCMHGSYKTCLFYAIMSEDPNWGYGMALTMPSGVGEKTVFHTIARLGEHRGLFENGVRGVGDMVGEFTARLAELDCELQYLLRQSPSPYPPEVLAVKWNWLEPVDPKAGLYRIFREEAPEPFGSNVIRLVAERGAKEIRVDFRGLYDPDTYGDWRACIVAVGADGRTRYSPMWNKGVMTMKTKPGDRRYWLCVAATPWALPPPDLYQGRYAPRYPYEVQLTGCRPGTPHFRPGDADDYDLVYTGGQHLCKVPHPGDTPAAERIRKALPRRESQLRAFEAAINKEIKEGKRNRKEWHTRNMLRILDNQKRYLHALRDGLKGARHPNGGGWVASSARVAPSAYVGPDAMVLDGARVLDNAIIENYAVVSGPKAVVSGHARLSGRAYVSGDVALGGYTRTWHQVTGNQQKTLLPPELPLRIGQAKPSRWKLWANYAMDREETVLLEDWFRFKPSPREFHELSLDGTLRGRPRFVVEDRHRGFQFDGRTQYAEAASTLADLGQITVDISLKWAGGANQVLFDFGSSPQDRFVLYAAGKSGRPELVATRGGRSERIVAQEPLPRNRWARCRVEIDGRQLALWIDGRLAGRRASDFRPCDAFPPDAPKRNFLAAARDGSAHFHGILDFVHVYYAVHKDFDQVPEPPRHAPRRVSREFIECVKKKAGGAEQLRRKIDERFKREYRYYQEMRKQIDARMREIQESTPQAVRAREAIAEAKRKLADGQKNMGAQFDKRHPELAARRADLADERKKLEKRKRELLDDILAKDKELAEARQAMEKSRAEKKRLDAALRKNPRARELKDQIVALTAEIEKRRAQIENQPDLVEARARINEVRRQRWKLEQRIRHRPELQALLNKQDLRQFKQRYRQLCEANAEHARLRQAEAEKAAAWQKLLDDRCKRDPVLRQLTARREAASREMPEVSSAVRAAEQYKTFSEKVRDRRTALERNTPPVAKLNRQISRIRDEERRIAKTRELYVLRQTADLRKQVSLAERDYAEAKNQAAQAFWPEFQWLSQVSRAAYSGYYNTPYSRYIGSYIRSQFGGEEGFTENPKELEAIYASQAPGAWKTRCDWEWRTRWELDGSIAELPLVREWLEKARDDVYFPPGEETPGPAAR